MCVCVRARIFAFVRVFVCMCVHACVCTCVLRELLAEDTPYWSDMIEEYKKPKYELTYVGEKPVSNVCCAPDNHTKKSYGYVVSTCRDILTVHTSRAMCSGSHSPKIVLIHPSA